MDHAHRAVPGQRKARGLDPVPCAGPLQRPWRRDSRRGVACDGLASFAVAGKCGGYGMLGALEMAKMVIVGINQDG